MLIYIVTVNNKISGRGYKTLEEAQNFIRDRVIDDPKAMEFVEKQTGYYIIPSGNITYRIEDVAVA